MLPDLDWKQIDRLCGVGPVRCSRKSRLTLRAVFADYAFVALQGPASVRAVLEPLGNACLSMDRAIHHRDAGLIAIGDDLFQAELTVAEHCDEGNEHEFPQRKIRLILPCSVRAKRGQRQISPVQIRRRQRPSTTRRQGSASPQGAGEAEVQSGRRLD